MTFGEKIRESRIALKMTQKQLADKIGAKHNSISDWENDKNKPDPNTIELLCGVLNISPNYLLNSNSDDFSLYEKEIIKKYRALDSHGKETVDYILNREYEIAEMIKDGHSTTDTPPNVRLINYYYRLASAGTGQILFDMPPTKKIEIPDIPKYLKVDYAIGVNGNSMKPRFLDGDMLLVEMTEEIEIGEIGIFSIDNECYVKELGNEELISLNPEYKNIPLNSTARCMGRVIDKL